MRFEMKRSSIVIIPESKLDEAYIEDTLGLKKGNQAIYLVRKNAHGLSSIAYLETSAHNTNGFVSGEDK